MATRLRLSAFNAGGPFFSMYSARLYALLQHLPPLLLVAPAALYAADLRRYDLVSSAASGYDAALPLDVVALVVLGLCAAWSVPWTTVLRGDGDGSSRLGLRTVGLVDFALWAAVLALADTTLSIRTATPECGRYVGGCVGRSQPVAIAAGTLMLVLAIVYQVRWVMVLHVSYWQRKCHPAADDGQGDGEIGSS